MSYNSKIKHINNILNKPLPDIFSLEDFMSGYNGDKYLATEEICEYVTDGLLKQIIRVTLSSGQIKDFASIADIPNTIFDIESGKTHTVLINDVTILYKKLL